MKRPIEVEVDGLHVRMRVGGIYMHSEEYANESNAKRAAKALIEGINVRPMFLTYWVGKMGFKTRRREQVRKVWRTGADREVALPVNGGPDVFRGRYFDPTLETQGA